jgi:hypothetical protein
MLETPISADATPIPADETRHDSLSSAAIGGQSAEIGVSNNVQPHSHA